MGRRPCYSELEIRPGMVFRRVRATQVQRKEEYELLKIRRRMLTHGRPKSAHLSESDEDKLFLYLAARWVKRREAEGERRRQVECRLCEIGLTGEQIRRHLLLGKHSGPLPETRGPTSEKSRPSSEDRRRVALKERRREREDYEFRGLDRSNPYAQRPGVDMSTPPWE